MNAAADTLRYFADLFAAHGVRWSVCGALAANAYRLQVRTTTDLDLWSSATYRQMSRVRMTVRIGTELDFARSLV